MSVLLNTYLNLLSFWVQSRPGSEEEKEEAHVIARMLKLNLVQFSFIHNTSHLTALKGKDNVCKKPDKLKEQWWHPESLSVV